jgi:hypothetical protein
VAHTDGSAGPRWKKSSWSAENGYCVEVAELPEGKVGVRDSKAHTSGCPALTFTRADWSNFVIGVKAGEFGCYPSPVI